VCEHSDTLCRRLQLAGGSPAVCLLQGKSTMPRSTRPASASKLHHVLAPKLKPSVRSTKALTLPDDFELETSKRCEGRPTSAQQPVRHSQPRSTSLGRTDVYSTAHCC
jgi:hypothetical protein